MNNSLDIWFSQNPLPQGVREILTQPLRPFFEELVCAANETETRLEFQRRLSTGEIVFNLMNDQMMLYAIITQNKALGWKEPIIADVLQVQRDFEFGYHTVAAVRAEQSDHIQIFHTDKAGHVQPSDRTIAKALLFVMGCDSK